MPILQAPTVDTFAEHVTTTVPTQPMTNITEQPKQSQNFCALCTAVGWQCPNNYMLPIHPEWSDLEDEKDLSNHENKEEQEKEKEEDRDGKDSKKKK